MNLPRNWFWKWKAKHVDDDFENLPMSYHLNIQTQIGPACVCAKCFVENHLSYSVHVNPYVFMGSKKF